MPFAGQARERGWELEQLDPPRRASRYFRHPGGMRSVHPDAFGALRRAGERWAFFLEWERRAVRPSTMAARLAPYLRYYASHRPADEHGVRPAVLVVLRDGITADHFLRVARSEMDHVRVTLPLWVSHEALVDAEGPLGGGWHSPGNEATARRPSSAGRRTRGTDDSARPLRRPPAPAPPLARRVACGPARRLHALARAPMLPLRSSAAGGRR